MIALTQSIDRKKQFGDRPTGKRDGVVLILSATGLSAAEISNLRIGDVRFNNNRYWLQVRSETTHGWTWRLQPVEVSEMTRHFINQCLVDYLETQSTDPAAPLLFGMSRRQSVHRVLAKYRRNVA